MLFDFNLDFDLLLHDLSEMLLIGFRSSNKKL